MALRKRRKTSVTNAVPGNKSSRSNGNGGNNCVWVRFAFVSFAFFFQRLIVEVRDSKQFSNRGEFHAAPAIRFSRRNWMKLLQEIKAGRLDKLIRPVVIPLRGTTFTLTPLPDGTFAMTLSNQPNVVHHFTNDEIIAWRGVRNESGGVYGDEFVRPSQYMRERVLEPVA